MRCLKTSGCGLVLLLLLLLPSSLSGASLELSSENEGQDNPIVNKLLTLKKNLQKLEEDISFLKNNLEEREKTLASLQRILNSQETLIASLSSRIEQAETALGESQASLQEAETLFKNLSNILRRARIRTFVIGFVTGVTLGVFSVLILTNFL